MLRVNTALEKYTHQRDNGIRKTLRGLFSNELEHLPPKCFSTEDCGRWLCMLCGPLCGTFFVTKNILWGLANPSTSSVCPLTLVFGLEVGRSGCCGTGSHPHSTNCAGSARCGALKYVLIIFFWPLLFCTGGPWSPWRWLFSSIHGDGQWLGVWPTRGQTRLVEKKLFFLGKKQHVFLMQNNKHVVVWDLQLTRPKPWAKPFVVCHSFCYKLSFGYIEVENLNVWCQKKTISHIELWESKIPRKLAFFPHNLLHILLEKNTSDFVYKNPTQKNTSNLRGQKKSFSKMFICKKITG